MLTKIADFSAPTYVCLDLAYGGGRLFAAGSSGIYSVATDSGTMVKISNFNADWDGLGITYGNSTLFAANGSGIYSVDIGAGSL